MPFLYYWQLDPWEYGKDSMPQSLFITSQHAKSHVDYVKGHGSAPNSIPMSNCKCELTCN